MRQMGKGTSPINARCHRTTLLSRHRAGTSACAGLARHRHFDELARHGGKRGTRLQAEETNHRGMMTILRGTIVQALMWTEEYGAIGGMQSFPSNFWGQRTSGCGEFSLGAKIAFKHLCFGLCDVAEAGSGQLLGEDVER
jgi:hypothetical protein